MTTGEIILSFVCLAVLVLKWQWYEWRIDNLIADCESSEDTVKQKDVAIEELCRQRDEDWAREPWDRLQAMEQKYARR